MRNKEPSTVVYFVRHGQTDFPHDRIYCDDMEDPPLNHTGRVQAKQSSLYFRGKTIDAIYTSPAARTRQTAQEIADIVNLPIQSSEALRERRFGQWEGMLMAEVEQQYPQEYKAWKADQVGYTPVGGETLDVLVNRVTGFIAELTTKHQGRSIIVVTHVGPIRAAVCRAFDIPWKQYRQVNVDNASITTISYGKTRNNLLGVNLSI